MLWDVCEEHLSEGTWRWTQWEGALRAPDFSLVDAAAMEEWVHANVAGLRAGGERVRGELLVPSLEEEDPSLVGVTVLAMVEDGTPAEEIRWLVRSAAGPVQHAGVKRALQVSEARDVGGALAPLLRADDDEVLAVTLETLAFRGEVPQGVLGDFLGHPDARLHVAALRSPEVLSERGQPRLSQAMASAHPEVRLAALEMGLASGMREAWKVCQTALDSGVHGREAGVLWALGGGEEDLALLLERLRSPERRADALWALGFSGWATAAEACLEWLEDGKVGRLAGEAFEAITGLRLEGGYALPFEALPPVDEDAAELDVTLHAEDFLPWPAAEAVRGWWKQSRGRFVGGTRYLYGHPYSGGALWAALERGPMRRRHVWAQELVLRTRGTCRVATLAFVNRQRSDLEAVRATCSRLRMDPLVKSLR